MECHIICHIDFNTLKHYIMYIILHTLFRSMSLQYDIRQPQSIRFFGEVSCLRVSFCPNNNQRLLLLLYNK
jgi:hypothetical protein